MGHKGAQNNKKNKDCTMQRRLPNDCCTIAGPKAHRLGTDCVSDGLKSPTGHLTAGLGNPSPHIAHRLLDRLLTKVCWTDCALVVTIWASKTTARTATIADNSLPQRLQDMSPTNGSQIEPQIDTDIVRDVVHKCDQPLEPCCCNLSVVENTHRLTSCQWKHRLVSTACLHELATATKST